MTRITNAIFIFLSLLTFSKVNASGEVEIIVESPQTIVIKSTICIGMSCGDIDPLSAARKVNANHPLRFQDAQYQDEAPKYYDIHLKIANISGAIIGGIHVAAESDTEWQKTEVKTDSGFNVTLKYRHKCATNYYGMRCGRMCKESVDSHTECSRSGETRCMHGWTGQDCMKPICDDDCNGHGVCMQPGKCQCSAGYTGIKCDTCIPKTGCMHGGCANNVSYTCECEPGYGGMLCNRDLDMCRKMSPCQNNGTCSNNADLKSFTCECPSGFVGERCEIAIEQVLCKHTTGFSACLNGGICYSIEEQGFQCKCPKGFSGKSCERPDKLDCTTMNCNGGKCAIDRFTMKPKCECQECYTGENCDVLDTKCLIRGINSTIAEAHRNSNAIKTSENSDSSSLIVITLLIVFVLLLSGFVICTRMRGTTSAIPLVSPGYESTPNSSSTTSPPVYKICMIDAEQLSDSDNETNFRRKQNTSSPPPAYYPATESTSSSSSMKSSRHYESLPTHELTEHCKSSPDGIIV